MAVNRNIKKTKLEDERKLLLKSARIATDRARKEATALGLPIQVISRGKLVEKSPNGEIKVIKKIEKVESKIPDLKKGMTICLKQND